MICMMEFFEVGDIFLGLPCLWGVPVGGIRVGL